MGKIAQRILLAPLQEGMRLAQRAQEGPLHAYLRERVALVVPAGLLMAVTSIACAAATVLFLGGTRSLLVLLAMLLVPFVLVGSFLVQTFIFFSWLENRALAQALHRKAQLPRVPWLYAALFLVLPLIMLVQVVA
jgi:hypothetical protein